MYPRYFFFPNSSLLPRMNPLFNGRNVSNILSGFKRFNWKSLLSGAGKTLNVIERTIPIVKETKPVINNMRSILKLTKAFNKETRNSNMNNPTINENIINKKTKTVNENNNITFFA